MSGLVKKDRFELPKLEWPHARPSLRAEIYSPPALTTCLLLHLLVGQVGLEPTMSLTTDLQSAALPILLTDPYLTYIMDYIILVYVCQVFFENSEFTIKSETHLLKETIFFLLKKTWSHQAFPCGQSICFAIQQASSLFLELSNNAQQTITSGGERQTRTVSSLFFRQISCAIIASIPHMAV